MPSLVGSEMCIRDRAVGIALLHCLTVQAATTTRVSSGCFGIQLLLLCMTGARAHKEYQMNNRRDRYTYEFNRIKSLNANAIVRSSNSASCPAQWGKISACYILHGHKEWSWRASPRFAVIREATCRCWCCCCVLRTCLGCLRSEEGALFTKAGRSEEEPMRAAKACI